VRQLGLIFAMGCAGDKDGVVPTDSADTSDTGDSGDPTPSECTADYTDALGSEPSFDKPHGVIRVHNEDYYPHLDGAVSDRPPLDFQVEAERIGQCRLLTYTPSSCDPVCGPSEVCLQGTCEPYPQRLAAGALTLTTEGSSVDIQPDALDGYLHELEGQITGQVTATLAGDEVPAFEVTSCAVQELQPVGDWSVLLTDRADGEDVVLEWSDPDPAARLYLRMTTGVATHGGIAHAEVECEGPDTGSLTLPGSFLDTLYEEGWSCGECGTNLLVRYRSGSAQAGEHSVHLSVQTSAWFHHIP
jgi:hypothetical protein